MVHLANNIINKQRFLRLAFILFIGTGICVPSFSQSEATAQFISRGKIEFERRINQHAFLDENGALSEVMKKVFPRFITVYSDLIFDHNKLLYKHGRDPDTRQNIYLERLGLDNIVSTDLDNHFSVTQKDIFGRIYLLSDSLRKFNWRISSEIRRIAGFNCRKAVGKMMDSLVVIAFYTDEIVPSGGPESFCGLPGMILGVAIPRLHTTWYATKVQLTAPSADELKAPSKGEKTHSADLEKQLTQILKARNHQGAMMQWQIML